MKIRAHDPDRLLTRLLSVLDSGDRGAILSADTARLAAQLVLGPEPDLPIMQAVGMYHWNRFLLDRADTESLHTALQMLIPVVTAFPERIPEPLRSQVAQAMREDKLRNPALNLIQRALSTGDPALIEQAIVTCQDKLAGSEPGEPGRQGLLANLSTLLLSRYRTTSRASDLREAVADARMAVNETPAGHRNMSIRLLTLGDALLATYGAGGESQGLDEALDVYSRAAEAIRPEDPRLAEIEKRVHEVRSLLEPPQPDPQLSVRVIYVSRDDVQRPEQLDQWAETLLSVSTEPTVAREFRGTCFLAFGDLDGWNPEWTDPELGAFVRGLFDRVPQLLYFLAEGPDGDAAISLVLGAFFPNDEVEMPGGVKGFRVGEHTAATLTGLFRTAAEFAEQMGESRSVLLPHLEGLPPVLAEHVQAALLKA